MNGKPSLTTFRFGSLILWILLIGLSSTNLISKTAGVDIFGCFESSCANDSFATGCSNFPQADCCAFNRDDLDAVLFQALPDNSAGYTYVAGGCQSAVNFESGPGRQCIPITAPSGAAYFLNAGSLAPSLTGKIVQPNAFRYTLESDKNGYWVVSTSPENLADLQTQFQAVPAEGKLAWLQSYGARYEITTAN